MIEVVVAPESPKNSPGDELTANSTFEIVPVINENQESNVTIANDIDPATAVAIRNEMAMSFFQQMEDCKALCIERIFFGTVANNIRNKESFLQYMREQANKGLFALVYDFTRTIYKSHLWMDVQHMRVRCSLIHQISIRGGSSDANERLLDLIFCSDRELWMNNKKTLKNLKRSILKKIGKLENRNYQPCGLMLNEAYPYICATPDGMTNDHIVEIKVPTTMEQFGQYLEGHNTIPEKYMAQLQLQMFMADMHRALYCVVHPESGSREEVHYVWVQANYDLVKSLLDAAEDFWNNIVFPHFVKPI